MFGRVRLSSVTFEKFNHWIKNMTDSGRTPQTSSGNQVVAQFIQAARYITDAERVEGFTYGGVTLNYSADGKSLTGTFTIPLERTLNSDGSEISRPANFLK